jgi:hypothetical protein
LVLKGRLQFLTLTGKKGSATFATVLLGYGGAKFNNMEDLGYRLKLK